MPRINKNKITVIVLTVVLISIISVCSVSALTRQEFITVKVNGSCISMDTLPYVKDNRTFVPVRFAAEALGADVEWVQKEKKVIITYDKKTIEMFQGSRELWVDGEKQMMDASVEISNQRTMVPVRFVAENMRCTVKWYQPTYSVLIYREDAVVEAAAIDNRPYNDDDIVWLSRIISVEGRGLSIDGKVAIANVVLNRQKSYEFPNSIHDVIFDKNYCVQFPPAYKEGFKELMPSGECIVTAKMALEGINNIDRCLFFNNAPFKSKSSDFYKKIDGEYFYY